MVKSLYCPFPFPERLTARLPPPGADGLCYVDILLGGAWEGVLVIDKDFNCIGVYVERSIKRVPLRFTQGDIEDVRPASIQNRAAAAVPEKLLWIAPYLYALILGPVLTLLPDSAQSVALPAAALGLLLGTAALSIVIKYQREWYCITGLLLLIAIVAECGLIIYTVVGKFLMPVAG
ncbi:MAG: hypothetical protein V3T30_07690 [Thermodesulfobacteriota bacterium]